MRGLIVLIWVLLPFGVLAQDVRAVLDALVTRLPGATLSEVRGDPDAFLEEAAGVILGFGTRQGVDKAGLEDAVRARRAQVRAREIRRMLQADLDGDLAVDAHEIDVAIRTASATMRGRLLNWHLTADTDADGIVSWTELRAHAQAAGLRALPEKRAAAIRALSVFDLDGDGFVRVHEVREAMTLLGQGA